MIISRSKGKKRVSDLSDFEATEAQDSIGTLPLEFLGENYHETSADSELPNLGRLQLKPFKNMHLNSPVAIS
jgi:hypothetical protein